MLDHARFQVKSAWWQRIASYLLGIVGVLLVYYGLDLLFSLIAADEVPWATCCAISVTDASRCGSPSAHPGFHQG